jgi:hypothetical protein
MTPDMIIGTGCILLAELITSLSISLISGAVSQGNRLKKEDVWSVTFMIFLVLLAVDLIIALSIVGLNLVF